MNKTINITFAVLLAIFYFGLKAVGQDNTTDVLVVSDELTAGGEVDVTVDQGSDVELLGPRIFVPSNFPMKLEIG